MKTEVYTKTVRKILKDRMLVRNKGNLRCIKDVFEIIFVLSILYILYTLQCFRNKQLRELIIPNFRYEITQF